MRELVFDLEYAEGCNPMADTLADHPNVLVRSVACHVTSNSLWRVDRATGPSDGLNVLERTYQTDGYCADCLRDGCDSEYRTQVLDNSGDTRVFYVRWSNADSCASIPHLALQTLGEGLLFNTIRTERQYRWKLFFPGDVTVSTFHAMLYDELCDCVTIDLKHITDASGWDESVDDRVLSEEQRETLSIAVQQGYYEMPRETDLDTLADRMNVPRSTISYRLRRAQNELAKQTAGRTDE